jgi:hypothetical protein
VSLSADDVKAVIGPIDEALLADILSTGSSAKELAEAWAWVNADEAWVNEGRPLPSGKVAQLIDLLIPDDDVA